MRNTVTAMLLIVLTATFTSEATAVQATGAAAARGGIELLGSPTVAPVRGGKMSVDTRRQLVRAVLDEANEERRAAGAPPLRSDENLATAARRYSDELAKRREIEHVSSTPGRRTFRDRIEAAGARARIAGENLARLTASRVNLADRVVRAWMRSPGHRANLLDPIFKRTGIGIVLGDDGVWYITQYYATSS